MKEPSPLGGKRNGIRAWLKTYDWIILGSIIPGSGFCSLRGIEGGSEAMRTMVHITKGIAL